MVFFSRRTRTHSLHKKCHYIKNYFIHNVWWIFRGLILFSKSRWPLFTFVHVYAGQRFFVSGYKTPCFGRIWWFRFNVEMVVAFPVNIWRILISSESAHPAQQTQNICITFIQRQPNVFDIGPTLYKCYSHVLCLLGCWLNDELPLATLIQHFPKTFCSPGCNWLCRIAERKHQSEDFLQVCYH